MVYCWPWAAERQTRPRHTASERPLIFMAIYSVNARASATVTEMTRWGFTTDAPSVHRGGNDPADPQRHRARQNPGGNIALLADLLPQVERRQLDHQREGDDEDDDAEAAENQ